MVNLIHDNQRGDTLIEVVIVIALVGAIVAGCFGIMNRMQVNMLNATERTAVRAEMNGQAELLQYIRARRGDIWTKIRNNLHTSATGDVIDACRKTPNTSFYVSTTIDGNSITNVDREPAGSGSDNKNLGARATVGNGIWIDAVHNSGGSKPFIDFYIKACWTALGTGPELRSTTIVRIYE